VTRFLDRDFVRAIYDPEYAKHIIGAPIDTGLSPDDTIDCILQHEGIEKVILDADNPIDVYPDAHEFATAGEHEMVRQKGGRPTVYERGLKPIIKFCEAKTPVKVPRWLACAPIVDDPDANDKRVRAILTKLGVVDAPKEGKANVDYSESSSNDRCVGCRHWMGPRNFQLSPCAKVDGLVRNTHWCELYEVVDGKAQGGNPQQAGGLDVRPSGGAQVSNARPESRGEREGAGNPAGAQGQPVAQPGPGNPGQG
jgi:hypothetical protein